MARMLLPSACLGEPRSTKSLGPGISWNFGELGGLWKEPSVPPPCHTLREAGLLSLTPVLSAIQGMEPRAQPVRAGSWEEKYFGLISSCTKFLLFLAGQTKPFHQADPGDSVQEARGTPGPAGFGAARAGIQGSIPEPSRSCPRQRGPLEPGISAPSPADCRE